MLPPGNTAAWHIPTYRASSRSSRALEGPEGRKVGSASRPPRTLLLFLANRQTFSLNGFCSAWWLYTSLSFSSSSCCCCCCCCKSLFKYHRKVPLSFFLSFFFLSLYTQHAGMSVHRSQNLKHPLQGIILCRCN